MSGLTKLRWRTSSRSLSLDAHAFHHVRSTRGRSRTAVVMAHGHFYANWFSDDGVRWNASVDDYMTELIQDRALAFIGEQVRADRPFLAYIAPHAPHTARCTLSTRHQSLQRRMACGL